MKPPAFKENIMPFENLMPIDIAPPFWIWLSIVLLLAGLCGVAWLFGLVRRLARRLPDRNEDMVLNEQPLR
ncbi:hypothetical protein [Ottowia sp.]|jgi:hypothetical protein|uniref:hypothetical protein n=1 Tax=Ottowia sp. TaxID=1898956 RepID=UPI0025ED424F|nr:hypothetical protein [Ottowia sp.]MBK6613520.1 hypothetical protein [Ottowia sp.]MBK6747376.1 hypothetical protein [Ottowia sp.]